MQLRTEWGSYDNLSDHQRLSERRSAGRKTDHLAIDCLNGNLREKPVEQSIVLIELLIFFDQKHYCSQQGQQRAVIVYFL